MCKTCNLPYNESKSNLLASLVNYNKLGSPQVVREELMETRWWNNNSGAGWIPLTLTQLENASYTDLKSCLIARGFESEVIEYHWEI